MSKPIKAKMIKKHLLYCLALWFVLPLVTTPSRAVITIHGSQLLENNKPFIIKGIYYSPWRPGTGPGKNYSYPSKDLLENDFQKLAQLNCNTIYVQEAPVEVLELAQKYHLHVLYGFWIDWTHINDPLYDKRCDEIVKQIQSLKSQPALMGWVLGNEVAEYQYKQYGKDTISNQLKKLYDRVKAVDPDHFVTHANWPITKNLDLSFLDVISFNLYPRWPQEVVSIGYKNYIRKVLRPIAGTKPLLITEFGMNSLEVTEKAQANILASCWKDITETPTVGGIVFEFSDEWWKNYNNPKTPSDWWDRTYAPHDEKKHDLDPEEYYGLLRDFKEEKPAFYAVQQMFAPPTSFGPHHFLWIISIGVLLLIIIISVLRAVWGSRQRNNNSNKTSGFTLIELLIVVAIIAILAAIGLYNYLAAQTRAKVSRVHADFATIATGLEAYYVDNNNYPPSFVGHKYIGQLPTSVPVSARLYPLTTPIAYLSSVPTDPFGYPHPTIDNGALRDGYDYVDAFSVDSNLFDAGDTRGCVWRVSSRGPDLIDTFGVIRFGGVDYDPTNGTVSKGDIVRTGALIRQFHNLPP